MRIAIFAETFLPKLDGVAISVCHLLDHLAERGHESIMFAPQGAPDRYAETSIIGLSSFSFPFYKDLKLVPPVFDVEKELVAFDPDVVHLVNPASLGLVGLWHARSLDIPVVASYQTDIPGYAVKYGLGMLHNSLWAYFRWIHNKADLNLCPSHFTKAELEQHGFDRVKVWSHGVDTERFSPRHRCAKWRERLTGGRPDAPLLLYVGRLALEKRVDWLRPLMDVLDGVCLAIVGEGPMRAELEKRFTDTPTVFTGFLHGEDLSRAYAAGDLFVFPSANETLGNVVLEAMASEMPVVAPRSGGVVDHVIDGRNGYLFDPDDLADMVSLVCWLLSDRERLGRLGVSAREYAFTQSWDEILDGLIADYEAVIETHESKKPRSGSRLLRKLAFRSRDPENGVHLSV